jgi:hypothetical protein
MPLENLDLRVVYTLLGFVLGFTCCAILFVAFWWGKQWVLQKASGESLSASRTPAATKSAAREHEFLHSLTSAQKRLETLLTQAEASEQKAQPRVTSTEAPPTDPYATAAFLLANGEDVNRVAQKLNLSPTQVRLVQELRQELEDTREENTEVKEEKAARVQHQLWGRNGIGH